MKGTITAELAELGELGEPSGPHKVEATIFGDWAAHGVFNPGSSVPDPSDCTVTHIPTGRTINSAIGVLSMEHAEHLAELLSLVAPSPTEDDAKRQKCAIHVAVAFVEVMRLGDCDGYRERNEGTGLPERLMRRTHQLVLPLLAAVLAADEAEAKS